MTTWSAVNNDLQVGVDLTSSDSTPSYGESITITCKWYVKSAHTWSDSQTLNWSFAGSSGSTGFTNTVSNSTQLVLTKTFTLTANTSDRTVTGHGDISGAYNGATPSITDSIVSPGANGAPNKPAAPTMNGSATATTMPIQWVAPATNGSSITAYVVGQKPAGGSYTYYNTGSTATTITKTGLTPNTSYSFTVRAVSAAGSSADSSALVQSTTTTASTAPSSVLMVDASTPSTYQLKTSWTPGASNGSTGITFDTGFSKYNNAGAPFTATTSGSVSGAGVIAIPVNTYSGTLPVAGDTLTIYDAARANHQWLVAAAGSTTTSIKIASTTMSATFASGSTLLMGEFAIGVGSPGYGGPVTFNTAIVASTTYYGWARVCSTSPSSIGSWVAAAATVTTGANGATGDLVDRVNAMASQIGADIAILDLKYRSGDSPTMTTSSANTTVTQAITFATPFPAGIVPQVQVTGVVGSPNLQWVSASGRSNTGFTINLFRTTAASQTVMWTAHSPIP